MGLLSAGSHGEETAWEEMEFLHIPAHIPLSSDAIHLTTSPVGLAQRHLRTKLLLQLCAYEIPKMTRQGLYISDVSNSSLHYPFYRGFVFIFQWHTL
jgi:hypothetical protein